MRWLGDQTSGNDVAADRGCNARYCLCTSRLVQTRDPKTHNCVESHETGQNCLSEVPVEF